MRGVRALMVACAAALVALGVSGCGEREQVAEYKQGRYQGKPDTPPWDNDPSGSLYTTSKWTKGDKASWEEALKQRALGQNEYTRTQ